MTSNKEIIALTDFEHVLERPTMYIGNLEKSEERIAIIKEGKIISEIREISVGFYKMMTEILDNAFDEAKRQGGKTSRIEIHFNSKDNSVKVLDAGGGFLNGSAINKKTGISNVASAMTMLRAGSNFKNSNTTENLIGTNGVGASIVNMLSDFFSIYTVNDKEIYFQSWNKFISSEPEIKKRKSEQTGTTICFTPRKDTFKNNVWDREYIHSMMIFRQFLKKNDPVISNLEFICTFDSEQLDLDAPFIPEKHYRTDGKFGTLIVWESFPQSTTVTFVNGAICGGIHHRIIVEWLNELFDHPSAHKFFECLILLNLPPKIVRFGDQNKTKFDSSRKELSPILEKQFYLPIKKRLRHSPIYESILKRIAEYEKEGDVRNLRNKKRHQKGKISDKYFPPSSKTKNLFIVEGGCIDENEKLDVYRNFEHLNISLSEIQINDEVITHRNRFKSVTNVQRKLKKSLTVTTKSGSFKCSLNQPFYVFDINDQSFKFVEAKDLNKHVHKLVKSLLADFIGTFEVVIKDVIEDEKYPILLTLEDGSTIKNSLTHSYCVLENDQFVMKQAQYIKNGDLIAVFEKSV